MADNNAFNPADLARQMSQLASSAASKVTDVVKSLEDLIMQAINRVAGYAALAFPALKPLISSLEKSAFQGLEREQAMGEVKLVGLGTTGGAAAQFIMGESGFNLGKLDISKLVSPEVIALAIEAIHHLAAEMHGSHISMGDGTPVQPMDTGGGGRGGPSATI